MSAARDCPSRWIIAGVECAIRLEPQGGYKGQAGSVNAGVRRRLSDARVEPPHTGGRSDVQQGAVLDGQRQRTADLGRAERGRIAAACTGRRIGDLTESARISLDQR